MRLMPGIAGLALSALVALSGCHPKAKLHNERTMTLDRDAINDLTIDATKVEQTVQVQFDSGGVPVSVYLVLGKDAAAAQGDEKAIAAAKAKAEKQSSGSLLVTVPANEELRVYVKTGSQGAKVNLKITN